jgi:hypothetical protein
MRRMGTGELRRLIKHGGCMLNIITMLLIITVVVIIIVK